jgi:small nuclear ribonucleoprotein (snRNP)-like protein
VKLDGPFAEPAGQLTCLDGYMNVALEDAEEWANGKVTARYGDCFVRGNNGKSGSPLGI